MKRIRIYYDKEMDTLDIWFEDPPEEGFSREISDGVILKYDKSGKVVGVEILFLSKQKKLPANISKMVKEGLNEIVDVIKAVA